MLGDDDVELNDEMWDLLVHLGYMYEPEPETAMVSGAQAAATAAPVEEVEDEEELGGENEDAKCNGEVRTLLHTGLRSQVSAPV